MKTYSALFTERLRFVLACALIAGSPKRATRSSYVLCRFLRAFRHSSGDELTRNWGVSVWTSSGRSLKGRWGLRVQAVMRSVRSYLTGLKRNIILNNSWIYNWVFQAGRSGLHPGTTAKTVAAGSRVRSVYDWRHTITRRIRLSFPSRGRFRERVSRPCLRPRRRFHGRHPP